MAAVARYPWAALAGLLMLAAAAFAGYQFWYLRKAHSTFENYYAFRGCARLIDRTDSEGHCITGSGQAIQIVKFDNRWYLAGDLPACFGNFCF